MHFHLNGRASVPLILEAFKSKQACAYGDFREAEGELMGITAWNKRCVQVFRIAAGEDRKLSYK